METLISGVYYLIFLTLVLFSFTNTNVAIFDIVISYFVSDTNQVEIKITISIVEYEIYLQFVL